MTTPPTTKINYIELHSRNVIDEYKDLPTEEIKKILAEKAFPFAVCFEHWQGDFNISTGIRNANAFGAEKVFYLGGKKKWDKRGAVGTHNYMDITYLPSIEALRALKSEYKIIGIDNIEDQIPARPSRAGCCSFYQLPDFRWGLGAVFVKPLMLFGEEGVGLTKEVLNLCDAIVEIPMFGSVRSLNCGTASGIVMNDFVTQYLKNR